ncbi:hypothetical protein SLW70_13800 [Flavobacterium sp. NG2]|uniref:hypothetical protein n=1 Tax=Flavobacterium sp. NG2 TaxID=3097547 RepID=UPI002A7FCC76|nr:hypothetical protein [Flavobacterium sp. NG2]WPR70997.1 hypothetical protein SLW70_13800 [Flavobacterium sp. NG2]
MKKYALLIALLFSFASYAHQPDLSTSVLSKTTDGKYILQITSSLSAFEGEIDYRYSKNAYKTAEDFNKLVVDYFRKNVSITVNDDVKLDFAQPLVILGHETKLIVEVLNLPKEIHHFNYTNTMFKDMPNNQMAVILVAEGLPNEQYILENTNKQTIELELKDGKWREATNYSILINNIVQSKNFIYGLMVLALVIISFVFFKDRKIRFSRRSFLSLLWK